MKSLYHDYYQKSRVFLYPVLEMKRGGSVTPIETYISWEGLHKPEDQKLICLYHVRDDREYKTFEKNKLLGNRLFENYIEGEDGRGIYIFDLKLLGDSWNTFLLGKYSRLSPEHKKFIKDFYRGSNNYSYVESYLHPSKYYSFYSDILGIDEHVLRETVELTDKPSIDKETLVFSTKEITFKVTT